MIRRLDQIAKFRRGQLSLIAAAPGGGKTALATHLAVNMAYDEDTGVPTMYWSADTDQLTLSSRILANIRDITTEEAEALVVERDPGALTILDSATDHMWWTFQSSPTLRDIEDELAAYCYVMGDYPHLMVIDNLMDIAEPGEEYSRYRDIIQFLTDVVRTTNAHIMLLHHVIGEHTNGNRPIPRSGIRQKVDEKPRLILTLYKPEEGIMGIRVVKNSNKQADALGGFGIDLGWLADRSWISD